MPAPNIVDLGTSLVVIPPSPGPSGTTLTVTTSQGTRFPATPFDAVLSQDNQLPTLDNAEQVTVTNITGDTLTIVRGQGVTGAKNIASGWRISNGIFASHVSGAYNRTNHTGTQLSSTISDFATAVATNAPRGTANGYAPLNSSSAVPVANLPATSTGSYGVIQLAGDLGGTAAAPTVPALANKVAKGDLLYNVRDYGAKGDGTTDDSLAFKNANTAATLTGGKVYAPTGTFILNPDTIGQLTADLIGQSMNGAILKLASGYNGNNNLLRFVSVSNIEVSNFTLDGNSANNSNIQYGLYISSSSNCAPHNLFIKNWNGDGIQLYNSTGIMVHDNFITGTLYHCVEVEQSIGCTVQGNRLYSPTRHCVTITPGEVGSQGSKGNRIIGNTMDSPGQYGVLVGSDNGGAGSYLTEGTMVIGNSITNAAQYGVCLYQEDKTVVQSNYIANSGFIGTYVFQSSHNRIQGNTYHNSSQSSNGAYDEIMLEGNSSGHASTNNTISHNTIIIDGTIKARYAINEGTSGDGPNIIVYNDIPSAGTSGKINSLCVTDILSTPAGVFQIYGTQGIQGANAGIDGPFADIMRLYNNMTNGETQIVNPNGIFTAYVGGSKRFEIDTAGAIRQSAPSSAPAAGDDNTIAFYIDESGNNLKAVVKYSNGTTKTFTGALT